MLIQLKYRGFGLRHTAGQLAAAVLCGSVAVGCSGSFDTPTEENPPRSAERAQTAAATPDRAATPTTPRPPAPAADEEEEDEEEVDEAPPPAAAVDTDEPAADEEEPPAVAAGDISFASDVWPIFNGQCAPCHTDLGLGGQNIGATNKSAAFDEAVDLEDAILSEIESGDMPTSCSQGALGDPGCMSESDFATIEAWYEAGAPE